MLNISFGSISIAFFFNAFLYFRTGQPRLLYTSIQLHRYLPSQLFLASRVLSLNMVSVAHLAFICAGIRNVDDYDY